MKIIFADRMKIFFYLYIDFKIALCINFKILIDIYSFTVQLYIKINRFN